MRLADDLLDGAAAAAEFVFGDPGRRRAIYRMTEAGELPVIRKGKRLFYRKSDLERTFAGGETAVATAPRVKAVPSDRCTYAQMLPLFVELYEPDPDRFHTLSARLRQALRFAKLGKVQTRGEKALYSEADVRHMLMLMELNHIGISQARAAELLAEYTPNLDEILTVTLRIGPRNDTITIDMAALRDVARKHLPWFFYPLPTVRQKATVTPSQAVENGRKTAAQLKTLPRRDRLWEVATDGPAPQNVTAIDSVGRVKPAGSRVFKMPGDSDGAGGAA